MNSKKEITQDQLKEKVLKFRNGNSLNTNDLKEVILAYKLARNALEKLGIKDMDLEISRLNEYLLERK